MKDRLVTFALAIAALALFYALFFPKPTAVHREAAYPLSTEIKPNGYQALWRWLARERVPVKSFRQHYNRLPGVSDVSTGNLLIATLPQLAPAHAEEWHDLDEWISAGNTVLVMAALDDTPEWAISDDREFKDALLHLTGIDFNVANKHNVDTTSSSPTAEFQQAFKELLNPVPNLMVPNLEHPLFANVKLVGAVSDYPASRWNATIKDAGVLLAIGKRVDQQRQPMEPALWLKRHGEGQLIICAFASPFSNRVLGQYDNARLFSNIVAWSVAPKGSVIFDDAHQGLVEYYDANAFFADSRLHRTLLWLVLLWLVFVLGWQHLKPQRDAWNPTDVTTFIRVIGGYFSNTITSTDTASRLFQNFFNYVRHRTGLAENGLPTWEWLSTQSSINIGTLASLRKMHERVLSGKRVSLVRLQNLLAGIIGDIE